MPIDEDYGPQIYSSNADLCNVRRGMTYILLIVTGNALLYLDGWQAWRIVHGYALPQVVRRRDQAQGGRGTACGAVGASRHWRIDGGA